MLFWVLTILLFFGCIVWSVVFDWRNGEVKDLASSVKDGVSMALIFPVLFFVGASFLFLFIWLLPVYAIHNMLHGTKGCEPSLSISTNRREEILETRRGRNH